MVIASIYGNDADARLIAAAPDLLAATQKALDLMDASMDGVSVEDFDAIYEALHGAARKAVGRG